MGFWIPWAEFQISPDKIPGFQILEAKISGISLQRANCWSFKKNPIKKLINTANEITFMKKWKTTSISDSNCTEGYHFYPRKRIYSLYRGVGATANQGNMLGKTRGWIRFSALWEKRIGDIVLTSKERSGGRYRDFSLKNTRTRGLCLDLLNSPTPGGNWFSAHSTIPHLVGSGSYLLGKPMIFELCTNINNTFTYSPDKHAQKASIRIGNFSEQTLGLFVLTKVSKTTWSKRR